MDIAEFEKQMTPKTKKSRLEPFKDQIFSLKNKGYANWQIRQFLEDNGLKVSQEAVRKFIKTREAKVSDLPTQVAIAPAKVPGKNESTSAAKELDEIENSVKSDNSSSGVKTKKQMEIKASKYLGGNSPSDFNVDDLLTKKG